MSGSGDITVWINSPGGDCVAAAQIYNMLMDYKGNVTVKIDGIAASAASVIAMAGNVPCFNADDTQPYDGSYGRFSRNAESNRNAVRGQGKHYERL